MSRSPAARVSQRGVCIPRGEPVRALGVVLSGSVSIENDDFWGNKSILDRVEAGGVFAETYACIPGEPLMVSVVAAEPSQILFLEVERYCIPVRMPAGIIRA